MQPRIYDWNRDKTEAGGDVTLCRRVSRQTPSGKNVCCMETASPLSDSSSIACPTKGTTRAQPYY